MFTHHLPRTAITVTVAVSIFTPSLLFAGTADLEWQSIFLATNDYMNGYLGKSLSGVMLLLGLWLAIAKSNMLYACAAFVGAGLLAVASNGLLWDTLPGTHIGNQITNRGLLSAVLP